MNCRLLQVDIQYDAVKVTVHSVHVLRGHCMASALTCLQATTQAAKLIDKRKGGAFSRIQFHHGLMALGPTFQYLSWSHKLTLIILV